jgi:hypothetical protein
VLAWVAACLLSAGCPKEPTTPTILDQRAQPYVQDIPVPKGFELDDRGSDHKYVAGRRSVNHVYRGSESALAVRNFYVHYMALAQWQLVNETLHAGVFALNFKKNDEKCEIRIEKVPSSMHGKPTQVRAVVRSIYAETPSE